MAGILFTGTARNEVEQEFYAEIDASEGWTVRPEWSSMEELLNEQYGPSSSLAAPVEAREPHRSPSRPCRIR